MEQTGQHRETAALKYNEHSDNAPDKYRRHGYLSHIVQNVYWYQHGATPVENDPPAALLVLITHSQ
jgi:hypothetical protein